jgi:hypothetical protein
VPGRGTEPPRASEASRYIFTGPSQLLCRKQAHLQAGDGTLQIYNSAALLGVGGVMMIAFRVRH